MKSPLLFALFLSGLSHFSFSQKVIVHASLQNRIAPVSSDTIYFDFNRNLSWHDFQGKPDMNSAGGAVTSSGFAFDSEMNYNGTNIDLNIVVYTFFTRHESWKKPEINSAYHLQHEQLHFDITRIGAEKFLQAVSSAHFTKDNLKTLLVSIFEKEHNENAAMQKQYDRETMHSINEGMQEKWNSKISAEIGKLKESEMVKN